MSLLSLLRGSLVRHDRFRVSHHGQRPHSARFEQLEPKCLLDGDPIELNLDRFEVWQNSDPIELDVLANDLLPEDLGISSISYGSEGGRVEISADGKSARYAPPPDFAGTEIFNYFVDGAAAAVFVQVNSPLVDNEFTVNPLETALLDVLENDPFWDSYQGERRITFVTSATQGAEISISDDGKSLSYLPADHANGKEVFVYVVDGQYQATVTLDIRSPFPIASNRVDEVIQNSENNAINVLSGMRFWDSYTGEQRITSIIHDNGDGQVEIAEDGRSVIYTPATNFTGYESFTIVVDATFARTASVVVHRPVRNDHIVIDRNSTEFLLRPLSNDYYYDLAHVFHRIVNQITSVGETSAGGIVSIGPDGRTLLYSSPADFIGTDTFEYIADGKYPATVTMNVTMPVRDDSLRVLQDISGQNLAVQVNDFLGNGYTGARLITSVSATESGAAVTISEDGRRLIYSSIEGFVGSDSLTYVVDGDLTATVRLNVLPLATSDGIRFELDSSQENYFLNVLGNDHFSGAYPGPGIITSISETTGGGQVTISGNGKSLIFLPAVGFNDSFTYTVDGKYEASVRVYLRNNPLRRDRMVVDQNSGPIELDVLVNDFSYLRYVVFLREQITEVSSTEQGGQVTVSPDGQSVFYTPPEDFTGTDSFTYTVDGIVQQTVSVDVTKRTRDDQFRVDPNSDQETSLPVLVNDLLGSGYQGAGQITSVTDTTAGGVVTIAGDGQTVLYTPRAGFVGTDSFDYRVDDQLIGSATVSVTESVQQVLPRFDSTDAFRQFLIDDALVRYAHLFGRPFYNFLPVVSIGGPERMLMAADGVSAGRDHSETNVQVAGVDEGDLIEVDDTYLYTLSGGQLVITKAWPAEQMEVVSRSDVAGSPLVQYLNGDRLTVISQLFEVIGSEPTDSTNPGFFDGDVLLRSWAPLPPRTVKTVVTVFDISDRSAPSVVQETHLEGGYSQSRRIDDFVFVILNNSDAFAPKPQVVDVDPEEGDDNGVDPVPDQEGPIFLPERPVFENPQRYQTEEEYLAWIEDNVDAFLDSALPEFFSYDNDGELVASGLFSDPANIARPLAENYWNMLSVVSVDMGSDEPGIVSASSVYTERQSNEYASLDNLYLFQRSGNNESEMTTALMFKWDGQTGETNLASAGSFPGHLLNQFSVDEFGGNLRVATTTTLAGYDNRPWTSQNDLFVLNDNGGSLELVAGLTNLSLGETIRSVRFLGERLFVTTFRTSDPLLAIDLSDATDPQMVGYLTIPGFSSYVQMIDANHMLTVGRNTPNGFNGPAQVSLIDVSDLTRPVLMDEFTMERFSRTEAALDHHAFGYYAAHDLLALPVSRSFIQRVDRDGDGYHESRQWVQENELLVFKIDVSPEVGENITLFTQIQHESAVRRSGYIADVLYSIANEEIKAVRIGNPKEIVGVVDLTPPVDPLPADLDGDGLVGIADLMILQKNFGRARSLAMAGGSLNVEGMVDRSDLTRLLASFGRGPSTAASDLSADATIAPEKVDLVLSSGEEQTTTTESSPLETSLASALRLSKASAVDETFADLEDPTSGEDARSRLSRLRARRGVISLPQEVDSEVLW